MNQTDHYLKEKQKSYWISEKRITWKSNDKAQNEQLFKR